MAEQFRLEQIRKEQEEEREVRCFTFSDNLMNSLSFWALKLLFNTHCNFSSKLTFCVINFLYYYWFLTIYLWNKVQLNNFHPLFSSFSVLSSGSQIQPDIRWMDLLTGDLWNELHKWWNLWDALTCFLQPLFLKTWSPFIFFQEVAQSLPAILMKQVTKFNLGDNPLT